MDTVAEVKTHLEYMFLKTIIAGLRDESMSIPDARQYAKDFLATQPFVSLEDMHKKIDAYALHHSGFAEAKKYMDSYMKEKDIHKTIAKMREHLQNNDIESALQVAKQ